MLLDVILEKDSVSFPISDPFHCDLDKLAEKIRTFTMEKGHDMDVTKSRELISKMIRGIAGCESGCPANAKDLVSKGFQGFELQYIEGGILSAKTSLGDGRALYFKMFPEF